MPYWRIFMKDLNANYPFIFVLGDLTHAIHKSVDDDIKEGYECITALNTILNIMKIFRGSGKNIDCLMKGCEAAGIK